MPQVILERISKIIHGKKVLDNVSLKIEEGSFVCLLGPAGGGKTTLLKIIAGLETPTTGAVYFDSENVTTLEPYKRDVSMVFQDFALYPHMTVFKNIASPYLAKKLPKQEIKEKVTEIAKFLKIDRLLERKISHLSGGEMQRVSIGRALAKEAKIVLFDEIFVNLDYKLREQMRVEFKELMDKVHLTTIFSSPDPEDAFSLADKVAMINEGKIIQYGARDTVYSQPADIFTGTYFGYPEMNLIECTVSEKSGKFLIDAESFQIPLEKKAVKKKITSRDYVLGVRPEHIHLLDEQRNEGVVTSGHILLTEVIGSDTIVHIDLGKQTIQAFLPGIYRHATEKRIYVSFYPAAVHLFEKDSGLLVARGA